MPNPGEIRLWHCTDWESSLRILRNVYEILGKMTRLDLGSNISRLNSLLTTKFQFYFQSVILDFGSILAFRFKKSKMALDSWPAMFLKQYFFKRFGESLCIVIFNLYYSKVTKSNLFQKLYQGHRKLLLYYKIFQNQFS